MRNRVRARAFATAMEIIRAKRKTFFFDATFCESAQDVAFFIMDAEHVKPLLGQALKAGTLWPHLRPRNYGKKTHEEVCRWASVDETTLPLYAGRQRAVCPHCGRAFTSADITWQNLPPASLVRHALFAAGKTGKTESPRDGIN